MNINIYNPYVRDELYHHGILGQRWGKRNGPPYPLGAGDHSASEKKAGWRKSLSDTDTIHKKYNKLFRKKVVSKEDEAMLQRLYVKRMSKDDVEKLKKAADDVIKAWNMADNIDKQKFRSKAEEDAYYDKMDSYLTKADNVASDIAKRISKDDKYKIADHYFKGQKLNSADNAINKELSDIASKKEYDQWVKKTGMSKSANKSYERAKREDLWNMEFLEMYQPYEWNKTEALAEYKKFLKDPDKWIKYH